MTFQMLRSIVNYRKAYLLVLLIYFNCSYAASARFDTETSILQTSCVRLYSGAGPLANSPDYSMELLFQGNEFHALSVIEIPPSSDCSGSFDVVSNRYEDSVRVGDELYRLSLLLSESNTLTIDNVTFIGDAETSLWRVSNGTNEVVIGGAIHVLQNSDFPLPKLFEDAYMSSDLLVTEVEFNELNDVDSFVNLLINPINQPLSNRLSFSTYNRLVSRSLSYGIPVANLDPIRTNWVAQTLAVEQLTRLGFGSGVDEHFMLRAQQQGKTNLGLESVVSQILVINGLNSHLTDDEIIRRTLDAIDSGESVTDVSLLVRAWREGDVDTLIDQVINPAIEESVADYNALLTNRNLQWIPQIEQYLVTPELEMVIVGVAHLVGPDSVLKLLESRGYVISRY